MSQMIPYSSLSPGGFASVLSALSEFAQTPAGRAIAQQGAAAAGRKVRQMYNSMTLNGPVKGKPPVMKMITGPRRKPSRKSRSRKGKRGPRGGTNLSVSVKNAVDTRIRLQLRDIQLVSTDANGTVAQYWQIADTYTSNHDFRTWLPKANTVGGLFTYFKVRSLKAMYKPGTGYTSTGNLALGVTDDVASGNPTSLSNILHCDPSIITDVKSPCEVIWRPGDNRENIDHLCNQSATAGTNVTGDLLSQGTIVLYAPTTSVTSGTLGVLEFEVDVEFYGLGAF